MRVYTADTIIVNHNLYTTTIGCIGYSLPQSNDDKALKLKRLSFKIYDLPLAVR